MKKIRNDNVSICRDDIETMLYLFDEAVTHLTPENCPDYYEVRKIIRDALDAEEGSFQDGIGCGFIMTYYYIMSLLTD